MDTRIVIAGAGGFGREVHSWLTTSPRYCASEGVGEIVFINDDPPPRPLAAPVVSTISKFHPEKADLLICAIGDPAGRRKVVAELAARGARFATFVHDSVILGHNITLGEGTVVCPGSILTSDISVGSHVHININTSIGHDVEIGDYATISPACNLMGRVTLKQDVFLGTAATVVPDRTIGESTTIGAGSIVVKDIGPHAVAFGNPCRVVQMKRDS